MSHIWITKCGLKTLVANKLSESTEAVGGLKHHHSKHRDSSTHYTVITGRLQLQTILTLILQQADLSIYRKCVRKLCSEMLSGGDI